MCGICGIFDPVSRAKPDRAVLEAMSRSIAHRGPDDEGILSRRRHRTRRAAALHHRRRGRPSADRERRPFSLDRLQWRNLQPREPAPPSLEARPSIPDPGGHRGGGPRLRGVRRGRGALPQRNVRLRHLGREGAKALSRPGSLRHQAALLHPRGRRADLRLRAEGHPRASACRAAHRCHRAERVPFVRVRPDAEDHLSRDPEASARAHPLVLREGPRGGARTGTSA